MSYGTNIGDLKLQPYRLTIFWKIGHYLIPITELKIGEANNRLNTSRQIKIIGEQEPGIESNSNILSVYWIPPYAISTHNSIDGKTYT